MSKIQELRAVRVNLVGALAALAALPTLSVEQSTEFDAKKAELEKLNAQLARAEYVGDMQATLERIEPVARPAPVAAPQRPRLGVENPGFASLGEVIYCARFQPSDSRIRALQEMNTGSSGGIAIPDEFNPTLREVSPQEAIFRPRCPVMPAGDMPDSDVVMPALDQATTNMYGGVEVAWTAEGGEKADTSAALRDVKWTPYEVSGSIIVTDKLLRNWRAAGAFLDRLLRGAILAAEDVAFLSGNGVGKPMGILKSPALKSVNRTTANTVKYADLVGLEAELLEDAPAIWIVNPRAIPKLRQMEDTAGQLIWNESARDGGTPTLLGRPVIKNFRSPALGSKGDVLLANLAHYVIKDGAPLQVMASEHVYFKNNKTVVKAFRTVGGQPWLNAPVTQEDSHTYSPFVALDVPA